MSVFRRLVALLVALLFFQTNSEGSRAACLAEHGGSSGRSNAVSAAATGAGRDARSAEVTAHGRMMMMASAHRAPAEAGSVPASAAGDHAGTMPADCPDSGIPTGCGAMVACSVAAVLATATAPAATEGRRVGEQVPEPDAPPSTRGAAPDVPPPRA